jgi:hypothetical protein
VQKYFRNIAIVKSKQKACIELFIKPDGNWEFNFISIKRKEKDQIEISEEHVSLDNIDSLKKIITNKYPLCLVINGKSIISKRVQSSQDDNKESLIQKALPSARNDEFYLRSYPAAGNSSYVSLIRRSLLEEILEFFSKNKICIVEVFWGSFSVNSILSLIGMNNGEIITEHYKFNITDKKITEYSSIEETPPVNELFKIGNEKLKIQSLISFSTLISHFYNNNAENSSDIPVVINSENEYLYSRMFVKTAWCILVFVFIVLLTNFVLFDYYNRKQRDLSSQVLQFNDLLVNQDTLKKNLESKRELLEKSGLLESSKISFYTDRIASIVNEGITLTRLEVNPLNEKTGEDIEETGYSFKNDSIQITGTASNSTYLNEWIKDIKVFQWVRDVAIKNYNRDNSQKPAVFMIEIKINSK